MLKSMIVRWVRGLFAFAFLHVPKVVRQIVKDILLYNKLLAQIDCEPGVGYAPMLGPSLGSQGQ